MLVTVSGSITFFSPAAEKASFPIVCKFGGSVSMSSFVQSENAFAPIDIMPGGSVTAVKALHFEKTDSCKTESCESFIFNEESAVHSLKARPPSSLSFFGSVTAVSFSQKANALYPIFSTVEGIVTAVRFLQYAKASLDMLVTPSSMTTSFTAD